MKSNPTRHSFTADWFVPLLERSGLKQTEVAEALGYSNPNIITMFKTGRTAIPGHVVPRMATLFGADPKAASMRWLASREPEIHSVLTSTSDNNEEKQSHAPVGCGCMAAGVAA